MENQKIAVIQKMKENGCRITKQRQVILDVIWEQEATSCKELFYGVSKIDSNIGEATVYRMIHLLEELEVIRRQNAYAIVMK